MKRITAFRLLSSARPLRLRDAVADAAKLLQVTPSYVYRFPTGELPRFLCDRILATMVRIEVAHWLRTGQYVPPLLIDAIALNHPEDKAHPQPIADASGIITGEPLMEPPEANDVIVGVLDYETLVRPHRDDDDLAA